MATFVEKKELKLLEEPVVSCGKFYYTSPRRKNSSSPKVTEGFSEFSDKKQQ